MRIAVLGNDGRLVHLKKLLAACAHVIADEKSADLIICGENSCPSGLPECAARVWCASSDAPKGWLDIRDEEYLVENAYLTAEGALCSAMNSLGAAVAGLPCAVVGFGRIGRALTGMLACLSARVFVVSRRESARRAAETLGAGFVKREDIKEILPLSKAVFTTSADMALDSETLKCVNPDAVIIDLASAPYGTDIVAAEEMGLNAKRESALPGRYCPESAAAAILKALQRGGAL